MEIKIPFHTQTNLNEWPIIQQQIDRTKIFRFPYKPMLKQTLTKYILEAIEDGLSSSQTLANVLREPGIKIYLYENPEMVETMRKNLYISICARFSEENTRRGK